MGIVGTAGLWLFLLILMTALLPGSSAPAIPAAGRPASMIPAE